MAEHVRGVTIENNGDATLRVSFRDPYISMEDFAQLREALRDAQEAAMRQHQQARLAAEIARYDRLIDQAEAQQAARRAQPVGRRAIEF